MTYSNAVKSHHRKRGAGNVRDIRGPGKAGEMGTTPSLPRIILLEKGKRFQESGEIDRKTKEELER